MADRQVGQVARAHRAKSRMGEWIGTPTPLRLVGRFRLFETPDHACDLEDNLQHQRCSMHRTCFRMPLILLHNNGVCLRFIVENLYE
jgi:hypothetical protein